MNAVGLTFVILFLVAALGLFGYTIYKNVGLVKKPQENFDYCKLIKKELIFAGVFSVLLTTGISFVYLARELSPKFYEVIITVLLGLTTSFSIFTFVNTFILHYYLLDLKDNNEKLDKRLYLAMMISFPVFIVSFLYMFNGFSAYMDFPLPNALSFTQGFVYNMGGTAGIAFYAIFILAGAIFVYFLCDHKFYQQYGKHGILESTFLIAFPSGILWARIGYVIGNWNLEFADRFVNGEWWCIFAVWEGGLTILSGAIGGIVVGVLWFIRRNKGYSIWIAVDLIVPTILLAQAIGRWGNFFNCEVHGVATSTSYWSWLPDIIVRNGRFSSAASTLPEGQMYVPLFLIESVINIIGYIIISYAFGNILRKHTELGDLAFGYVLWYGLVRTFMEPLRYGSFNMGENGYWSWIWAMVFVLVASVLIAINHFARYLSRKKNNSLVVRENSFRNGIILTSVFSGLTLLGLILGISLMSTSSFSTTIVFNQFNIGLLSLILGVSAGLYLFIFVPLIIEGKKREAL